MVGMAGLLLVPVQFQAPLQDYQDRRGNKRTGCHAWIKEYGWIGL